MRGCCSAPTISAWTQTCTSVLRVLCVRFWENATVPIRGADYLAGVSMFNELAIQVVLEWAWQTHHENSPPWLEVSTEIDLVTAPPEA